MVVGGGDVSTHGQKGFVILNISIEFKYVLILTIWMLLCSYIIASPNNIYVLGDLYGLDKGA